MNPVTELIDVKYKDLTNYPAEPGGDIIGSPFEHYWGPIGVIGTYNKQEFFEMFPDELPNPGLGVSASRFFAFANLKKALNTGGKQVEALRIQGAWKYTQLTLIATSNVITITSSSNAKKEQVTNQFSTAQEGAACVISGKYAGCPCPSLIDGYDAIGLTVLAASGSQMTIQVLGLEAQKTSPAAGTLSLKDSSTEQTSDQVYYYSAGDWTARAVLEEWIVSLDPKATLDGKSIFLDTVLAKSQYLAGKVINTNATFATYDAEAGGATKVLFAVTYLPTSVGKSILDPNATGGVILPTTAQWKAALDVYEDGMVSEATILLQPLNSSEFPTGGDRVDKYVIQIAGNRQNLTGVAGYETTSTFDKASLKTRVGELKVASANAKFSQFVAAREEYNICGLPIVLNGIGGWAGSTAGIADSVRTNQLASAFTYGGYNGTLVESLTFSEVQELMKVGVTSIFASYRGPIIWGTRSLHSIQESYFGKANVMRVLAKVLRQVFPICLEAIHVDAATNPQTRSDFQRRFTSVIDQEISLQNLLDDSYADCGAGVNTDKTTKGGTIFNLNLALHFIGLSEMVKINVFATDSSVTTSIQ